MNKPEPNKNWFSRAKAEADKGVPPNDRVVGIAIVVVSILMMLYFAAHQVEATGFFTTAFGALEAIMLYGNLTAGLPQVSWRGAESTASFSPLRCFWWNYFHHGQPCLANSGLSFQFCLFRRRFARFPQVRGAVDIQRYCSRANGDWGYSVYCCSSFFSGSVQVREQGKL